MERFLDELNKLNHKKELSKQLSPDYFEPGIMEYLDQYEGYYDEENDQYVMCFEVKGTRYEGRTELIETVHVNDEIVLVREKDNKYNYNHFDLQLKNGKSIGVMPKELANVIAPLYDEGKLSIINSYISFADPISKRSRYAKQAVAFVCIKLKVISL